MGHEGSSYKNTVKGKFKQGTYTLKENFDPKLKTHTYCIHISLLSNNNQLKIVGAISVDTPIGCGAYIIFFYRCEFIQQLTVGINCANNYALV